MEPPVGACRQQCQPSNLFAADRSHDLHEACPRRWSRRSAIRSPIDDRDRRQYPATTTLGESRRRLDIQQQVSFHGFLLTGDRTISGPQVRSLRRSHPATNWLFGARRQQAVERLTSPELIRIPCCRQASSSVHRTRGIWRRADRFGQVRPPRIAWCLCSERHFWRSFVEKALLYGYRRGTTRTRCRMIKRMHVY